MNAQAGLAGFRADFQPDFSIALAQQQRADEYRAQAMEHLMTAAQNTAGHFKEKKIKKEAAAEKARQDAMLKEAWAEVQGTGGDVQTLIDKAQEMGISPEVLADNMRKEAQAAGLDEEGTIATAGGVLSNRNPMTIGSIAGGGTAATSSGPSAPTGVPSGGGATLGAAVSGQAPPAKSLPGGPAPTGPAAAPRGPAMAPRAAMPAAGGMSAPGGMSRADRFTDALVRRDPSFALTGPGAAIAERMAKQDQQRFENQDTMFNQGIKSREQSRLETTQQMEQLDIFANAAAGIARLPPEQRGTALETIKNTLVQNGQLDPGVAQSITPENFIHLGGMALEEKERIANDFTARDDVRADRGEDRDDRRLGMDERKFAYEQAEAEREAAAASVNPVLNPDGTINYQQTQIAAARAGNKEGIQAVLDPEKGTAKPGQEPFGQVQLKPEEHLKRQTESQKLYSGVIDTNRAYVDAQLNVMRILEANPQLANERLSLMENVNAFQGDPVKAELVRALRQVEAKSTEKARAQSRAVGGADQFTETEAKIAAMGIDPTTGFNLKGTIGENVAFWESTMIPQVINQTQAKLNEQRDFWGRYAEDLRPAGARVEPTTWEDLQAEAKQYAQSKNISPAEAEQFLLLQSTLQNIPITGRRW